MGLGPDVLHGRNEQLVILRISGWGQEGSWRHKPGFGTLVEAFSGFAAMNGHPDRPPVVPPFAMADAFAGLYGATAALTALRAVEIGGGKGQVIDLSLIEPILAMLGPKAAEHRLTGETTARMGSRCNIQALRDVYATSDGKYVALSTGTQGMAERLLRAVGRPELVDDPRYRTNADRLANREEIEAIVRDFIAGMTQAEALAFFDAAEVTVGPVCDEADLAGHPYVHEREVLIDLPDRLMRAIPMHNVVPRLSATPGAVRTPAPAIGEHNAELLRGLGYTVAEIEALTRAGVLGGTEAAAVMARLVRGLRRLLRLLTRPVRATRGQGELVLQPYRGYGTADEVFLIGRAFRQPGGSSSEGWWGDLRDLGRRFLRRSIADAPLVARFCGAEQHLRTDRDGYFRVHLTPAEPPPAGRDWHPMELALADRPGVQARGEVFVAPPRCRFVVISDIDDTVTETGVANKAVMLWRLFMLGAKARMAFPGVAALLRALHDGRSGGDVNPMLYVSRGPWSIYEILDAFFNLHRIPIGPLLFLREWGMTWESPLPRRDKDHKLELIRNMLALYRHLPIVLIGDSGQRDPEIYAQVVREHPGRVLAIYIRNVSRGAARPRAIEDLAVEVLEAGSTLLLAADSMAIARHAAEHGLIAPETLADVAAEMEGEAEAGPTHEVEAPSAQEAEAAVRHGALADALDQDAPPANVEVEAHHRRDARRKG